MSPNRYVTALVVRVLQNRSQVNAYIVSHQNIKFCDSAFRNKLAERFSALCLGGCVY